MRWNKISVIIDLFIFFVIYFGIPNKINKTCILGKLYPFQLSCIFNSIPIWIIIMSKFEIFENGGHLSSGDLVISLSFFVNSAGSCNLSQHLWRHHEV